MSRRLTTEEFIIKSKNKHGNKYDYSNVEYINANTKICVICPKHGKFWVRPANHMRGDICKKCHYENYKQADRQNVTYFISKAKKIHGDKYCYSKVNYQTARKKVCIICPEHGEFLQTPDNHTHGKGCPSCNVSQGELRILKWLSEHSIKFTQQYTDDNCKSIIKLPFDFHIPSKNLIIEYDGIQHYEPVEHFGGISKHKEQVKNDTLKNDFCKEQNISLLRIPYWEYDNIEVILENEFSDQHLQQTV